MLACLYQLCLVGGEGMLAFLDKLCCYVMVLPVRDSVANKGFIQTLSDRLFLFGMQKRIITRSNFLNVSEKTTPKFTHQIITGNSIEIFAASLLLDNLGKTN
jgi:hypothetical protein